MHPQNVGRSRLLPERLGLDHVKRLAIDADDAIASLAVGHSDGGLLAAEDLHGLNLFLRRHLHEQGRWCGDIMKQNPQYIIVSYLASLIGKRLYS